MQSSRNPRLSMARVQHSTGYLGGTFVPWITKVDEATFPRLFEATNGLLFGLLLRILGHTQTAEEVLAEVYEELSQKTAQFGKRTERPLTWLILITHRHAIERLCRQRATKSVMMRERRSKTESDLDSQINITEQRRLVRAALEAIPPLQHRMVELSFFAGMSNLEIAQKLGQSPEAVEGGLQFAMLQLFGVFKSMGFSAQPATHTLKEV